MSVKAKRTVKGAARDRPARKQVAAEAVEVVRRKRSRSPPDVADAQRAAVRDAMKMSGQTQAEIALELGCSRTTLTNYANGAGELSMPIWRKVITKWPQLKAYESERPAEPQTVVNDHSILVAFEACAGLYRPSVKLPIDKQRRVYLPTEAAAGSLGVLLSEPGAELFRPAGTILVCTEIKDFSGDLHNRRVVLERSRARRGNEVTVRLLKINANEAILWWESTHPDFQAPLRVPYVPGTKPERWVAEDGTRYFILAVVVWAGGPVL